MLQQRDTNDSKNQIVVFRPGFARVNLPYFMDDETVHFVLEAVDMIATHGWKLLPQVTSDSLVPRGDCI